MKRISVIGHFGFGLNLLNGQTIKTKIITEELERIFGNESVKRYDTHGGLSFALRLPFVIYIMLSSSKNVIIMPGDKGLLLMMPLIAFFNMFFRRHVYYVVIGGWLPSFLHKWKFISSLLKRIDGIFVETLSLQETLEQLGYDNIVLMPNCKRLLVLEDLPHRDDNMEHLPLCLFSRIMKEKGTEDAVRAVTMANKEIGHDVFSLDIYGEIWKGQERWFQNLLHEYSSNIRYMGRVNYYDSVSTLKDYYALLFPTYYKGECFPGTIIDAFAAGLPVFASDWHENSNIVADGRTGMLFPAHSVESLSKILIFSYRNQCKINGMRRNCLAESKKYFPEVVVNVLVSKIV